MNPIVINGKFLTQIQSGVQRYSYEIVRSIDEIIAKKRDLNVTLLCPINSSPIELERVKIVQAGSVKGALSGHIWEQTVLRRYSKNKRILALGNTLPYRCGKSDCVVIHDAGVFDVPDSYAPLFRNLYKLNYRIIAKSTVNIATVSDFSRTRLSVNLRVSPQKIRNVGEGGEHILRYKPDNSIFSLNRVKPMRYLLVVGASAKHKNMEFIYQLSQKILRLDVKIIVTGGVGRKIFNENGEALNSKNIIFLGQVNNGELRALYENAIALIFASKYEGFGLPPLEAMYCGCPVLVSKIPSMLELVGGAGLMFDPESVDDAIDKIHSIKSSNSYRSEFRELGLRRCSEYTWSKAARLLIEMLESAR